MRINYVPFVLGILLTTIILSCDRSGYSQEYISYQEFNDIKSKRLTCWFPQNMIKSDASNIKNLSFLDTKCVFGVFDYSYDETYQSIFTNEDFITKKYQKIFISQIKLVENIAPEWFPELEYWTAKKEDLILFDNCYVLKDTVRKKIYYFHPEEESTLIDNIRYPGIRNTVR